MSAFICKSILPFLLMFLFAAFSPVSGDEKAVCLPLATDYTMMWWANGWYQQKEPGKRIRNIQTGYYAMSMDVDTMQILHLGPVRKAKSYDLAVRQDNSPVFRLPPAGLEMALNVNGKRYRCTGGTHPRLIDSGRLVQRGDVIGLVFADSNGEILQTKARAEITAWPETLSFVLEAGPERPPVSAGPSFGYRGNGYCFDGKNNLEFPHTPELEPERLTASIRVFIPEGNSKSNNHAWLLCKNAHECDNGNYGFYIGGQEVEAVMNIGGGKEGMVRVKAPAGWLGEGKWIHLVMSYDGVSLKLFVNGRLADQQKVDRKRTYGSGPLSIARRTDNCGHGFHFTGVVDDLAIYPEALSPAQIKTLTEGRQDNIPSPAFVQTFDKPGEPVIKRPEGEWRDLSLEINLDYAGRKYSAKEVISGGAPVKAGEKKSVNMTLKPADPGAVAGSPDSGVKISAIDPVTSKPVKVEWKAATSCYSVDMGRTNPVKPREDYIDSGRFKMENTSDREAIVPVCFDQTPCRGVIGVSPVLREIDGIPTGIPVQISKNWHNNPEGVPHNGPWLHAFALLRLPARSAAEYQLDLAHAYWGQLPAVSHAQLCVVGYGGDQQWDQVAIGSWGESICYDPDINLNRSIIDDVRPLMVRGKSGREWSWSNNVGGGDFLVYDDESGKRQPLVRMKTAFLRYCPVLTEVVYAGVSADNAIEARITVSTPRANDFPRHFHSMRYDVKQKLQFKRLAFYQIAADRYNENWFSRIARGSADAGLAEEWEITRASGKYDRVGIAASGSSPWFSFHGVDPVEKEPVSNGGAARGLILRGWEARLGGRNVPVPYFSVYGAKPSAVLELAVPPGVEELLPGDYLEATFEYIILPAVAEEYYGPDEVFRKVLSEGANTWKPVHREALVGNNLKMDMATGKLAKAFPINVRARKNRAEFSLTGAIGYVPLTVSGLSKYRKPRLEVRAGSGEWRNVDQSAQGCDFWQTDYDPEDMTWSVTFTVTPDTAEDTEVKHEFRFCMQ